MKFDKSLLQRATDQFVIHAREMSSRGTSFLIVILGVLLQASHTTLLMYNVSAFENVFIKGIVSLGIGLFISMALAVFTLKHDGKNAEIASLINVFFYFEVFTNLFYYFDSILLQKGLDNATLNTYIYFAAALPFAYIMPYSIKKFAGVIAADQSVDFGTVDVVPVEPKEIVEYDEDAIQLMITQKVEEALNIDKSSMLENINNKISEAISNIQLPENKEVDVEQIITKATELATYAATKASSENSDTTIKKAVKVLQEHFDDKYIKKGGQVVLRSGAGQETTVDVM